MTRPSTKHTVPPVKVYWQPGCSSCLKTKEFLIENGVPFQSVNVLENETGFKELEALGLRLVPIVVKGTDWANGAVFRDVARVVGFKYGGYTMLTPEDLSEKIIKIQEAAYRYLVQIPENKIDTILPGRPRSYRQLVYHVFTIPKVFLDHIEHGSPYTYEALKSILPRHLKTKQDLLDYGLTVRTRYFQWWENEGKHFDFKQPGNVYYGEVSLHEVLERTAWHSGQHTRQIILMLREKLNIAPDAPLEDVDFAGLPMPKNIWDNEQSFNENSYKGKAES